jgi:hypothetical protein
MRLLPLFAFCVLAACHSSSNDQTKGHASNSIEKDLMSRYPTATDFQTDTLDDGFIVGFSTSNNRVYQAEYDKVMKLSTCYSTSIDTADLTESIKLYIANEYPDSKVNQIYKIEIPLPATYQIELENDTDYVNLLFSNEGELIEESSSPVSDEEVQQREGEGVKN